MSLSTTSENAGTSNEQPINFRDVYQTYSNIVNGQTDGGNTSNFSIAPEPAKGPTTQNTADLENGAPNAYNDDVSQMMEERPVTTKWDQVKEGFSDFKGGATGSIDDMKGKWGNNAATYGFFIGKPLYKMGSYAFNNALANAAAAGQAHPLPLGGGQAGDNSAYYAYLARYRRKKKNPWEKDEEDETI